MKQKLTELLGALPLKSLTQSNIELILSTIEKYNIEDDDVEASVKEYASRLKKPYDLIDNMIFGKERKKQEKISKLTVSQPNANLFSAEDMKTPWNILETIGFQIYQDNASQKDIFWMKSIKVDKEEGKKIIITKTNKDSFINILNSLAQEHQLKWNKPIKDSNGNVTDFNETLIDFKEADLTRFYHKKIVFDPTTKSNLCMFQNKECLNSYTAPSMLHIKSKAIDYIPANIDLFVQLILNLTDYDEDAAIYILHWLARNYQTKQKHETMLIFAGEGRTGKGLLMELITLIYGEEHIGIGSKKNNIFDNEANKELKNKLYYHADEIEITKENWSSVKRHTGTNFKFLLKELYADSRAYPNTANFIFNLNTHKGEIPFKIPEQGDLRMCCFETFSVLTEQEWWIEEDNKTYNDLTSSQSIQAIATFLATFEYNDNLIRKPFKNDLRIRMLKAGQSSVGGFALALRNKDYDWLDDNGLDTIVWYNTDGTRAKGYDWHQHLDKCYDEGYITLKDSKNLFMLLFPGELYKSTQMLAEGMVEKNKPIEQWDGTLKSTRLFELPKQVQQIKRDLKAVLKGKNNE